MAPPRESSDRSPSLLGDPGLTITPPPRAAAEVLMRTCPNCGKELAERKCKLYCPDPRCGYFLSCADYY